MNYFDTLFAKKYGVGGGSMFATLFGKSLGGATPTPVMPSKGDIIAVDMDGDGTAENYLVLKTVSDGVVEVLDRVKNGVTRNFGESTTYENSGLDLYAEAVYSTDTSSEAKNAIVTKTFRQAQWNLTNSGNPIYTAINGSAYQISLVDAQYGNSITRHMYAPSLQDYIDYLEATPEMTSDNTTLTKSNMNNFFNSTTNYVLSADCFNTTSVATFRNETGKITGTGYGTSRAVYLAFQIDLDKITWSPVG